MTTFKQFLLETDRSGATTSKELTVEETIHLIKTHCQDALQVKKMYRGGPLTPLAFADSTTGKPRKSANTRNYYTVFIENDPAWKDFPKRSRSFIGSTSVYSAYESGDYGPHYMIPYNDAKIGICPDDDFWTSFTQHNSAEIYHSPSILNKAVDKLFSGFDLSWVDSDWSSLKTIFKNTFTKATIENNQNIIDIYKDRILGLFEQFKVDNVFDLYAAYFAPTDFKYSSVKNFDVSGDREIWVEGKAIFVSTKAELLGDEYNELRKFLNPYGYYI